MANPYSWKVLDSRYENLMDLFNQDKRYSMTRNMNRIGNTGGSLSSVQTYLKANDEQAGH